MESNIQAIIIPEEDVSLGLIGELRKREKKLPSDLKELMEIPRFFKKDVF